MRGWTAALAILGLLGAVWIATVRPHIGVCQSNDAVADRGEIEAVALQFVTHLYDGRPGEALAAMIPRAQNEDLEGLLDSVSRSVREAPGANRAVRELHALFQIGPSSGATACVAESEVTALANGGGLRTAFVVISEDLSGGAERSWTLWLSQHDGRWRVRRFNVGLSAIAGRSAADLLAQAQEQDAHGHAFNATILYDLAGQASDRGTFFQSAVGNRIAQARAAHRRHPEIAGAQPFTFHLGGRSFLLDVMRPYADGEGRLALILVLPAAQWRGQADAERRNRELIEAMNRHRGEWREVFDYLVVQSPTDQPERSWGTVYRRDTGYIAAPTAPGGPR